jgi:hypothetical protein
MDDVSSDDTAVGSCGGGSDYSTPTSTTTTSSSTNGVRAPNKVRVANGGSARMPPFRNGFAKKILESQQNQQQEAATATATRVIATATTAEQPNDNVNGVRKAMMDESTFVDRRIPAEFVADTKLPTDVGQFRLRAYRTDPDPVNEFTGREPSVIYAADKPPFGEDGKLQEDVPIRIHDQCLTSEVFRSQR